MSPGTYSRCTYTFVFDGRSFGIRRVRISKGRLKLLYAVSIMDLLYQIFEGSHVLSEISKSKPAINRWRVGFLKCRSKINKEGWGGITISRLYFPPKLISVTLFCLFLERSEYKLCWAHKPYVSHAHRILGTITPSSKHVCLFRNDFRKCVQVSKINQLILSLDIQCRHFSNAKHLGDSVAPS